MTESASLLVTCATVVDDVVVDVPVRDVPRLQHLFPNVRGGDYVPAGAVARCGYVQKKTAQGHMPARRECLICKERSIAAGRYRP